MFPGTGSAAWDAVLQLGIILAMIVSIILLIKNYLDR